MKEVKPKCPSCNTIGIIEIEKDIIEKSQRGITAINIANNVVCEHSFVIYVDKNYVIRDYFIADFKIELPNIKIEEKLAKESTINIKDIDLYLISINVSALEFVNILYGIFQKKKILLIKNIDVVSEHIMNMMEYIFQNSYEYDFTILKRSDYRNYKKKYKNHIIIEMDQVLNQKYKEMISNKAKIESKIVQKFLSEQDLNLGLIILKNEIYKSFIMAKSILDILQNYNNEKKISKKKLVDLLSEAYETKIESVYLNFLLKIVKNYFKFSLSRLSDYFFPSLGL